MVPVASNHATHIVDRNVLPCLISDVLPAGNLFKNQQANFIAGIKKMPRLGIMGCSHDVAFELVPQDLCVASLGAPRHGLPDVGKCLVTIESAQFDHFSIQFKTVIGKLRLAKTKSPGIFINNLSPSQQADPNRIQVSMFEVP